MALQPGLLDTSIISRGARESKIDLATPVNIYTSLQANKRANQQEKRTQSLADLTLSREEQQARKRAQFQEILRSSLNEKGQIDSEKAVSQLNQAGFTEQAFALQERKRKAFEAKSKQRLETNFEMGRSFGAVLKSENPVEAFMIARNDAVKQGLPISDGLLNYFPTDEEIQDGRLDPKVAIELDYLSQRATRPKGPMSIEDKLLLMNKLYEEKKNLAKVKSDIKVDQPLTEGQKQKERLAGKKDIRAEKTLGLKEEELELKKDKAGREQSREERENEKWMAQVNRERTKKGLKKAGVDLAAKTVVQDMGRGMEVLEKNMKQFIPTAAGPMAWIMKNIPATDADILERYAESVKSNISIDRLQAMREASPTGGALGQVPVQQQEYLMQLLGSLDVTQKPEILLDNMKRIYNIYMDAIHGVSNGPTRKRISFNEEGKAVPGGVEWSGTEFLGVIEPPVNVEEKDADEVKSIFKQ